MPQPSDVVLNGDGYMLVGGKGSAGYVRSQDGMDEGRTGRITQTDFFGGQRRALQLENDRGFDGVRTGPALDGQGVTAWPYVTTLDLPGTAELADPNWLYPCVTIRDYVYFAIGRHLWRTVLLSATSWSNPTLIFDAGVGIVIHGLCYYAGNILITFDDDRDITHVLYPDCTSPAVLFAAERGRHIVAYGGYAIWSDARPAGFRNMLRMVTGSGIQFRWADGPIKLVTTAQSAVQLATGAAMYSFSGRVAEVTIPNPGTPPPDNVEVLRWSGDLTPEFQHGTGTNPDDFVFVEGFGGKTYAWIGGMVLEHDPNGERAGWKDAGLAGVRCFGACVAAGYLVVSIVTHDNKTELWAWDGQGWWCIHTEAWNGSNAWLRPMPMGGAGAIDVLVMRQGTRTSRLFRLVYRSATNHNTGPGNLTTQYVSSLLDADDRDKAKAWRKVGAEFATPELLGNLASANAGISVQLSSSIDAGTTWTVAGTQLLIPGANTLANNNFDLDRSIASNGEVSKFIMLRVVWTGQTDWAPILTGLWAEFETLDSPARRRRWSFTVQAEDRVIDRDGAQLTRTGREQISELWDHWEAGTTVPFRDLDYDSDTTERQVRIVGIRETVPVPHEAGNWGQSHVALVLVEV